jgi:PERQ amino acid-rich with GYF domain-containing protein
MKQTPYRSRRDSRSTNGGTLTFRRSSTTPLGQTPQQTPIEQSQFEPTPSSAVPNTPVFDIATGTRYSKEQIIEVFKSQKSSAAPEVARLFVSGWHPGHVNGSMARGWGKNNDSHVLQDPDVCWSNGSDVMPMNLHGMSSEEKEV